MLCHYSFVTEAKLADNVHFICFLGKKQEGTCWRGMCEPLPLFRFSFQRLKLYRLTIISTLGWKKVERFTLTFRATTS